MSSSSPSPGFVTEDYIVFGLTIVLSLAIGIYFAFTGGKQKTTSEYLLANRKMNVFPVSFSLVVSFESSILMLGYPAEIYLYGVMYLLSTIGFLIASFIAIRVIVPLLYPLKLTSAYEYLELRYKSKGPRIFGTALGLMYYVLYMGIVLYGPAIALNGVADFPIWASILSVASASIIYTSMGGFKAVVWTDVFQFLVMMTGIFAVLIKGTLSVGGVKNVFEINNKNQRLHLEWDPNPTIRHSMFTVLVGFPIRYIGVFLNQTTIQRISSVPKQSDAKKVLIIAGPMFCITFIIVALEGFIAYSYFHIGKCDPFVSKQIGNANQLVPFMVITLFRDMPGMSGLFIASLFSASLSTISSGLSSLSAQTVEDIVKPFFKITDTRATLIAKCSVLLYGGLAIAVSFLAANIDAPLSQIGDVLLSCAGGPLIGIFLYSFFFPWATKRGVFAGGICGMAVVCLLSVGQTFSPTLVKAPRLPPNPTDQCLAQGANTTSNLTAVHLSFNEIQEEYFRDQRSMSGIDRLFSLSYVWFATVGILAVMFVGTIASFLGKRPDPSEIDTKLVIPICERLCPCLPLRIRQRFHCGVKFDETPKQNDDVLEDEEMKALTSNKIDIDT